MSRADAGPGRDTVLEVRGLEKHFGGLYALSGLDMDVRRARSCR